ncbi:MAG: hypothetical protein A3G31_09415 [Candidatus Schekmanbacteria bacterium RIFCSPLOWO2_12_FULL_38_15]|uniref:L-2-amino-thiazoline-4-carboxylic acid hydrolase n=1 Tax=Candidatus Schekmanbacteria bacterium RIFCSPLOWO2_12_FULL_38_15 TaxID=1817883 RepID=A0A1F7SIM3_9BACT|nr:MAG: hypothetical protein A3G31_09415 [Candidatus Schekmanbacteria bacterium RIFCSPLOWO2_12_FULL_38_15]
MDQMKGKEIPVEKQREILVERNALKFTELHMALTQAFGEKEGARIYEEVYELRFKKGSSQAQGRKLEDIIKAELSIFPALGWKLWAEKKVEDGEEVWYEHLEHCPYWTATKKHNLPAPCKILCDMDSRFGEKYKLGLWKLMKHMPSGDSECCFRITPFK